MGTATSDDGANPAATAHTGAAQVRNGIRLHSLTACPCCGASALETVLANGCDYESELGRFEIVGCRTCGIQFTNPQPHPDDISLLYASRNSHDFDVSSRLVSVLRRYNNLRQLKRLPGRLRQPGCTALDYGCGGGFFTESMRSYLKGRVIGSDFHAEPPPIIAANDRIEYVPDHNVDRLQGTLDLVICRNVLEHTVAPVDFLARLRSLLRPGGCLMIEVPNRASNWATLLGKYNFNYYLPRHLYHFDRSSLGLHLSGFNALGWWFDHSPILGKSFGHLIGRKISGFGLLGLILLPLQVAIDLPPGKASQLVVIAERV